ncbi:hypothetical protein FA13DRAFT_1716447 [Coprinellus micaceus]|uniref:Uncharacterized protein n=1 Tax=Coprinellus micaceus TaxID=71717 RepID=A0A4Y7SIZ7_COPMI|nr:hypothetical protein FA13DRAFT_1716447 [Coprinellus micaceus]
MSREWRTFEARSQFPELLTRLPSKYERRAPRWDGSPPSFQAFLDEYSELCDELGILDFDEKKITSLLRYAPNPDIRYMWKLLSTDPRVSANWNDYRSILVENTPGAEEELQYTKGDLEEVVRAFQGKPLRTLTDLSSYWERFFVVSEFLRANGRLSKGQQYEAFLDGLPDCLRRRVHAQIRAEYPTKYPDDPLALNDAFRITSFVLSAYRVEIDDVQPRSRSSGDADASVPVNATPNQTRIVNVAPNEVRTVNRVRNETVTSESTSALVQAVNSFKASMEALSATLSPNTSADIVPGTPQVPSRWQNAWYHPQDMVNRSPAATGALSDVYTFCNVETIEEDILSPSPFAFMPLPVPTSLQNSSPQRQIDVHVNEIFSTTTKSSDDNEVSQLEKMVQNTQNKLDVARRKADSLSRPQYQSEASLEDSATLGDPFERSLASDGSPIIVSTYELASANLEGGGSVGEVTSSRPTPPSPHDTQNSPTSAEHDPKSHDASSTNSPVPIDLVTPSIPFSETQSPLSEPIPDQPIASVESVPFQSSHFAASMLLESVEPKAIEHRLLTSESSSPVDSRSVQLQPLVPAESNSSTSVEYRSLTPKSSTSTEYRTVESPPLVLVESKLHASVATRYITSKSSPSVEFKSHTPVESTRASYQVDTAVIRPPPHSPAVNLHTFAHKTPGNNHRLPSAPPSRTAPLTSLPQTHAPEPQKPTEETDRTIFDPGGEYQDRIHVDPGGYLLGAHVFNEFVFEGGPFFNLPSVTYPDSSTQDTTFGICGAMKHGNLIQVDLGREYEVESGGYPEDESTFDEFRLGLALPFGDVPRYDPPLPTHLSSSFVLTASQNEKVPGRCGDACALARRHHQLPNPVARICTRSIGAVPRVRRDRFPCQGPFLIVLSFIPVARSVALSNGLAHLRRY